MEEDVYTFIPKINFNSRSLALSLGRNTNHTEANLLYYGKKVKENLQLKRENLQKLEMEEATFQPNVSRKVKNTSNKENHENFEKMKIHERLFDNIGRGAKRQVPNYEPECRFRPDLTKQKGQRSSKLIFLNL